ncbi:hypothetical protein, partial [Escherichia coli]|uniref:hypothetical protein n=1 Tax=Escherichia coli TaxID=562 RepID=UPI0010CC1DAE
MFRCLFARPFQICLRDSGWTALEAEESADVGAEDSTDTAFDAISTLKEGDVAVCDDVRVDKKETKPLPI